MSGPRSDQRGSVVVTLTLIVLVALGWFVFPGQNDVALAVGAVVALVLGTFFGPLGRRLPLPVALGVSVGLTLMGLLLRHLFAAESRYTDYGAYAPATAAATNAVAGFFYGLAARAVALALLRRPRR